MLVDGMREYHNARQQNARLNAARFYEHKLGSM